jgi:hypothetical protein
MDSEDNIQMMLEKMEYLKQNFEKEVVGVSVTDRGG